MRRASYALLPALLVSWSLLDPTEPAIAAQTKKSAREADPYAEFVWPPPPDTARIKLEAVLTGRLDVEGESKLGRLLIGKSPKSPWDDLKKPFAVEFDREGRVLVSDTQSGGLLRFDLANRRFDVLGTQGPRKLKLPLGIDVGPDGTIFVADPGQSGVIALHPDGALRGVYGAPGELENPTDALVDAEGKLLFVADSKGARIVVYDLATARIVLQFGSRGSELGEFNYPTSLALTPEGNLAVVDQLNARIQILTPSGEPLDAFGRRSSSPGGFVRPKDVAVDEVGFFYVTDHGLNTVQLFDVDFTLLTYVGSRGLGPGGFDGASGVAVQGDRIAVVDQQGARLQLFRFLVPKTAE